MSDPLILASTSAIRQQLLTQAGISFETEKARVDERLISDALEAEDASPRDIADTLAEAKAQKVANRYPERFVLGCDQTLALKGALIHKAGDPDQLRDQLTRLSGQTHHLYAAAVLYQEGKPIWRHVGSARMSMRHLSAGFIDDYVTDNWDDIQYCVGGYMIESIGVRLFQRIEGDYHSILGLPLLPVIDILTRHEMIAT